MKLQLDDWQKEILEYKGDIILCKGRRIGGTEIFSIKAAERMVKQPGVKIVFISLTEDQAKLCISVALEHLTRDHRRLIGKGKLKPQLGAIFLSNGSWMKVRPVGNTGNAIRGFDGDILGVDEAPWQPAMMWQAARPIISTNDGEIWMWGTPNDDEGYFYEQFDKAYNKKDPKARFKVWYKNTEEVLEERKVCESWTLKQQEGLRRILAEEKKDMSAEAYGNEYLGLFLSVLRRLFKTEWIDKVSVLEPINHKPLGVSALGVDIAALGDDESTFEGLARESDNIVRQFHHEITTKTMPTETEDKIKDLNVIYNFWRIGLDDSNMGVGVLAHLLREDATKRKVVGLNNARRAIDYEGRKTKLQKEAMYYNLLEMGERGELQLFNAPEIQASLRSIQVSDDGKIDGRYSHIVEGIIRAGELLKHKNLNIMISSIKI